MLRDQEDKIKQYQEANLKQMKELKRDSKGMLDEYKSKQKILKKLEKLLKIPQLKSFYDAVNGRFGSMLLAGYLLRTEMIKREDSNTEKAANLVGGILGDVLSGACCLPIGSTISFIVQESVGAVKGRQEMKKIKNATTTPYITNPTKALEVAELISRNLTSQFKIRLSRLKQPILAEIAGEKAAEIMYHHIKNGKLEKSYDHINGLVKELIQILENSKEFAERLQCRLSKVYY